MKRSCTFYVVLDRPQRQVMAPKRKGLPDKGAAEKLANALGTQLFTRIKVSDLQHEVLIKRKFQVPGSWWGKECPDD